VAGFLGRDDWEALFSCFLESPHGFESHENLREYFGLCGLLETAGSFSKAEPQFGILEDCSSGQTPEGEGENRTDFPPGCAGSPGGAPAQPSGRDAHRKVHSNLLADRSLYGNEVFSRSCAIYEAEKVRVLTPYSGVRETLGELKRRGIPLAIVTDAMNGNALARLRKTGLSGFFDHVISYDMTGAKKPAPDAFLLALEKLGTHPSETLLVGDSLRRDIAPAQALGMITAYARYGDRNVRGRDPPDCRPDYVLDDIRELVRLV
jgi:putative hydrolase of the HAD superfamily